MIALRRPPTPMAPEPVQASGEYYGELEGAIILENAPSPSSHPMGRDRGIVFYLPLLSTLVMEVMEKLALVDGPGQSDARGERWI